MNRTYRTYKTHKAYSYLTRRRALIVISVLLGALLVSAFAAAGLGSEPVAVGSFLLVIILKLMGTVSPLSREQDVIIFSLRLPRIDLAIGVVAGMAGSGVWFLA